MALVFNVLPSGLAPNCRMLFTDAAGAASPRPTVAMLSASGIVARKSLLNMRSPNLVRLSQISAGYRFPVFRLGLGAAFCSTTDLGYSSTLRICMIEAKLDSALMLMGRRSGTYIRLQERILMKPPRRFSRRRFATSLTAAAGLAVLPSKRAISQPAADDLAVLGARPDDLSPVDWDEVRAKYANVLRVYGNRLSEDEKHRVAVTLKTHQYMLASIRQFEVQNGDPSACTLRLQGPDAQAGTPSRN